MTKAMIECLKNKPCLRDLILGPGEINQSCQGRCSAPSQERWKTEKMGAELIPSNGGPTFRKEWERYFLVEKESL